MCSYSVKLFISVSSPGAGPSSTFEGEYETVSTSQESGGDAQPSRSNQSDQPV